MNRIETMKILIEIVSKIKKMDLSSEDIQEDTFLGGDLGLDSVEMLEVLYDLQKKIQITIPQDQMVELYTIKDVLDLLSKFKKE